MLKMLKDLFDFTEYETAQKEAASYYLPPTISQYFNWENYDNETGFFELNTGNSVAAIYELFPISTEGQPNEYLREIREGIEEIFRGDTFRQYYDHESPWIIQIFCSDDFGISGSIDNYKNYIKAYTQFSKTYCKLLAQHLHYITKTGGIFEDPMSGTRFRGRLRKTRMVIYRRLHSKSFLNRRATPKSDLNSVCVKLEKAMHLAGIEFKKCNEEDFYNWMAKWLSPNPKGFKNTDEYLSVTGFPKTKKPAGFDITQAVFASGPDSDTKNNVWNFDDLPHRFIPIVGFLRIPADGHLTAERKMSKSDSAEKIKYYAPFDHLPEGAIFTMTIVIQNQEFRKKAIEKLKSRAKKSLDVDAQKAGIEGQTAEEMIAEKNFLFPVGMGVFIRGRNLDDLLDKEESTVAVLAANGFKALPEDRDMLKIDRYIRFMPMNYNYTYDKKYMLQSRLVSVKQIASVLPVYGRTRGTGNPCWVSTNRLCELVFNDPLADKQNNAHGLILGTTGSGKSNMSALILMQFLSTYFPRMVIIDAGGSFRYVMEFIEKLGIKLRKIEITMQPPEFSLNPFTETKKMLAQVQQIENLQKDFTEYEHELEEKIKDTEKPDKKEPEPETENRDYLMEFVTAAMLMITGGEQKEIDALNRQDRYLVIEAIKEAGRTAIANGFNEMIPSDLAESLISMANNYELSGKHADKTIASHLIKMANGIKAFIHVPLNAMYFNKRGAPFPDSDVTWFEMGLFKDDRPENEAPRALAFITMMNNTMSKAEKYKASGRPFIFYADECHIVTSKPITAASLVQCAKMSRKVFLWIWLATQNTDDFPASARKAVSMLEYKVILWCDKNERKKIAEFVELTEEQHAMFNSLRKVKQKYVEAVLLSNSGSYLLRNVPPREVLALAMTDGDENAWRFELQKEFNCDGVIASILMAQKLRGEEYDLKKAEELFNE
jgi:conjugative transfer ATPase